jgi:hypothetical protein
MTYEDCLSAPSDFWVSVFEKPLHSHLAWTGLHAGAKTTFVQPENMNSTDLAAQT